MVSRVSWLSWATLLLCVLRCIGEDPQVEPESFSAYQEECFAAPPLAVIDITPYVDFENYTDADRASIAKIWDEAFSTLGVAQIIGHQVPTSLINTIRGEAATFFSKSNDEKASFTFGEYGNSKGGFTAMGVEAVAQSVEGVEAPYDLVENFVFRCEENGSGMEPPWEKTPFPSAEQYVVHMERVLRTLHEISAIALGLEDRHYFDSFYTRPNGNALRLAHYPPLPADANAGHVRYGEHTDYSGFTLLHQDPDDSAGAGGLQVQDPQSKQWIPVSPIADYGEAGFVVNIGDLWKRWTNDRWMSTNHRVMNPEKGSEAAKKSRFSVVFFTGPRADAMIDTLPGQGQSKHAPISAGEHLAQKLARSNV